MRLVSFLPARHRPARSSPKLRATVALAFAALLVAPAAAEPDRALPPADSTEAPAAKPSERSLDFYFAALAAARDEASAARARGRIEAHWNRSGSDTADLLAARAATAVHAGDRALALDLVDAAIVVAPRWPTARLHRAMIRLADHDLDRAVADLMTTLAMEPRHLVAMSTLAAILETTDRRAEALKWLRALARLDPRNPAVATERLEKLTVEVEGREL